MEQNRDVMAMPGSVHNIQASGCHQLLQAGATLVTSAEEVLAALSYHPSIMLTQPNNMKQTQTDQPGLLDYVGDEMTTIDQVVQRSGLGVGYVISTLSELELEGSVKAVPGGYMRCIHER